MNKPPQRIFEFDSFRVDVAERQVWRDGKILVLTPKVFDILLILLENKGQTVEKEKLIQMVWAETFVEEGSLNRNVSTLRKILGDDSNEQRFIKTLPKRGYRFTANVREIVEDDALIVEKNTSYPVSVREEISDAETRGRGNTENFSVSPLISRLRIPSSPRLRVAFAASVLLVLVLALVWTFSGTQKSQASLLKLTENERQQLAKRSSNNAEAVENYVNGRALWRERSSEGLHKSILLLERAVAQDPNFALAHAALADAYAFDVEKWKMVEAQAAEAIRLDPSLGEPHAAVGFVRMFWEWKLKDAESSFKKAVELSPDYATAHQWYALNLVARVRGGAALAEMKRALELEPNSLAINADMCQMLYFLQKYDEALAQCQRTLGMDANFLNAHLYLYEIYTAKGMFDEAIAEFFKIEQLRSDFSSPPARLEKLRAAYARGGIREFWRARLEIPTGSYQLAQYHVRLGEKPEALRRLREAAEKRDFDLIFFFADPVFQDLRVGPAFGELEDAFLNGEIKER